jgi:pSer/pThr/pTyr-binding forkhead associated (FHA) protein
LSGSEPRVPALPSDAQDWDDDRPTDIKMHGILDQGGPASDAMHVARPADQTDEYPLLIQHEVPADEPLPSFVEARLEVLTGPDLRGPFYLKTVKTVIGRGQAAHVRVHDTRMSKEHASILYAGSEFRIRDEKSTNGTFLNGSQVVEYAIRDGDKLLVGDSILRFVVGSGS